MTQAKTAPIIERWRGIVDIVAEDLEQRGVYQPKMRNLAEIAAKVHSGESKGGKGLFLSGTPGTGKTFLLRAFSAMFGIPMVSAMDVERVISNDPEFRALLRMDIPRWDIVPPHYNDLIIDDVGTENTVIKDFGRDFRVIEETILLRYEMFRNRAKTHFSTNLTETQFRERYGERCWSRVCEMCCVIVLNGPDRRIAQ